MVAADDLVPRDVVLKSSGVIESALSSVPGAGDVVVVCPAPLDDAPVECEPDLPEQDKSGIEQKSPMTKVRWTTWKVAFKGFIGHPSSVAVGSKEK